MLSRRAFAGGIFGTAFITGRRHSPPMIIPRRPIRVISPFPPGSASDTVGRVVLDQVSQMLGQPMVIETKPGAGGIVGFADVAKADPDGYTLVTSSTSMGTGKVLHQNLPYDPEKDFVSVAMFGVQPNVLVASTAERVQDGRRSRCGGKGEARNSDLRLRRRRLVVAYGRRAAAPRRQDRRPPCAVPRQWPYRSDGGTHRLLFHSVGGGGFGARQRQA